MLERPVAAAVILALASQSEKGVVNEATLPASQVAYNAGLRVKAGWSRYSGNIYPLRCFGAGACRYRSSCLKIGDCCYATCNLLPGVVARNDQQHRATEPDVEYHDPHNYRFGHPATARSGTADSAAAIVTIFAPKYNPVVATAPMSTGLRPFSMKPLWAVRLELYCGIKPAHR